MAPPSVTASSKSFEDLQGDFYKEDIFVRLIHSWEARNIKRGNVLMGVELLLIDSKAFIPANRMYRFKSSIKPSSVYKLSNFIVRPAKLLYKVASYTYGISFTDQTSFVEVDGSTHEIASRNSFTDEGKYDDGSWRRCRYRHNTHQPSIPPVPPVSSLSFYGTA